MNCPHCGSGKTQVKKTESQKHESFPDPVIRRRRQCVSAECRKPYYTYEVYAPDWRRLVQVLESADLLEDVSGLIRTRLKTRRVRPLPKELS